MTSAKKRSFTWSVWACMGGPGDVGHAALERREDAAVVEHGVAPVGDRAGLVVPE